MLRRSIVLGLAAFMLAASAAPAQKRERQKEIRLEMARFATSDGNSIVEVGYPGALALGIYLSRRIAIEPQISFVQVASSGTSAGQLRFGFFIPYYLAADTGKTGFFISPGVLTDKGTGSAEYGFNVDYGVDVGIKRTRRESVSLRLAATFRNGGNYADPAVGVSAGLGIFWK